MNWLVDASAWILPVVLAVTLHEAAHGWVAEKFGDNTARMAGRVTFDPFKHIDRFGTIIFPAILLLIRSPIIFGYAKPVPVDFNKLSPPRLGMLAVALAGVAVNFLLALASAALLHIDALVTPEQAPWLYLNLYRSLIINCVLIVFNLVPILPLDGGRAVDALLAGPLRRIYRKAEPFGIAIVMGALLIPMIWGIDVGRFIGVPAFWLAEQVMYLTGNVH